MRAEHTKSTHVTNSIIVNGIARLKCLLMEIQTDRPTATPLPLIRSKWKISQEKWEMNLNGKRERKMEREQA